MVGWPRCGNDAVRHPFLRDLKLPFAIRPELREQNIDTINGGGFTDPTQDLRNGRHDVRRLQQQGDWQSQRRPTAVRDGGATR